VYISDLAKIMKEIEEGIAEVILVKPIVSLRGETIKKFIPDVYGYLFTDSYKIELENNTPIRPEETYKVIMRKYEIEVRDKDGNLVQVIKGELLPGNKT